MFPEAVWGVLRVLDRNSLLCAEPLDVSLSNGGLGGGGRGSGFGGVEANGFGDPCEPSTSMPP